MPLWATLNCVTNMHSHKCRFMYSFFFYSYRSSLWQQPIWTLRFSSTTSRTIMPCSQRFISSPGFQENLCMSMLSMSLQKLSRKVRSFMPIRKRRNMKHRSHRKIIPLQNVHFICNITVSQLLTGKQQF